MKIVLTRVSKGPKEAVLPAVSVAFRTGEVTLARAETEQRPTVLGLIASGRMRPDSGTVTIDDEVDYGAMRKRIALVDAPSVCEPASDVTVAGVVAEELMFAGRRSHPVAVSRALAELGVSQWAKFAIGTVPPTVRIGLLAELSIMRPGVEGLVITSPDRHGGDPNEWWQLARGLAARGLAILVVAGDASAAAIAASGLIDRIQATSLTTADFAEQPDVDPDREQPGHHTDELTDTTTEDSE